MSLFQSPVVPEKRTRSASSGMDTTASIQLPPWWPLLDQATAHAPPAVKYSTANVPIESLLYVSRM